jgi:hypothetical protein
LYAASRTYEALKDVSKKDYVLKLCEEDEFIELVMLLFFQELGEDFVNDNAAKEGLTRLHGKHTPPAVGDLSVRNKRNLLSLSRVCPDLSRQQGTSSFIALSTLTDGTFYSVDLNDHEHHDSTNELAAMRVVMTAALDVGKARGMGKEEFVTEAQKLFNTEVTEYDQTFDYVVGPTNFQPQQGNDEASAASHFDAMAQAATNTFSKWCNHNSFSTPTSDKLMFTVFKVC